MTKRTLASIIAELNEIRSQCLTHARAEPNVHADLDWHDLALQATIAREIAANGIYPARALADIHALLRSMELNALHRDIERALAGGGM